MNNDDIDLSSPDREPPRPRTVNIVPHTHWDREWYRPFQSFRMQLVDLLDGLLPELESNPAYAHFMLDGQMAVIDDYLAVRPEQQAAIRRLAASGRLSVGPWFILMDEFLVSGETTVRNLRLGLDRASEFGGAMQIGYLPDMFGHVAQMPQLLSQFGFEHAVVWRGVPSVLDAEAFRWEAPDGSSVRAEYLPQGYSNGAVLPDDAKELVARIDQFCTDDGALVGDPVLWMNGTDHLLPQPWLGRVVAEANEMQDEYRLVVTSLTEHVAAGRTAGLPTWQGELRSGARSNLLMGVASNRTDIRQAAARTERAVEQLAEPLAALFLPADRWPAALLHEAWGFLIRNSAHDSICACSVDAVCDAVLHRYAEAGQIAEGITQRALAEVLAGAGGGAPAVVVNPSMHRRSGLVEIVVAGDEPPPGTQVLSVREARSGRFSVSRGSLEQIVVGAVEQNPSIHDVTFDEDDAGTGRLTVTLHADGGRPARLRTGPLRARLAELAAVDPEAIADVQPVRRPTQQVIARVSDVDGFGWRSWKPAELDVDPVTVTAGPAEADAPALANGLLEVSVDPHDATFSINGLTGLGRLIDDGDGGDTYNWSPPAGQTTVDRPESVTVAAVEHGPLRARLVIDATYRWPERIEDDRRVGTITVAVRTMLELRAGEDLLRVTVELDNRGRDHRLRSWFALPEPARTSRAECAFAVVERGLTAEGGPNEVGLPTYPSRRFVSAGGLTVVHEGLAEYELVDIRTGDDDDGASASHALALTLLRCTGVISRGPMTMRPMPAGPPTSTPGAQMPGPQRMHYALHVGDRDPYEIVDDAFLPLIAVRPRGTTTSTGLDGPASGRGLTVSGAQVSAVTRTAGNRLEVRVFNPGAADTMVEIDGRSGWMVDLRGRASQPFEGSFPLRAGGIQTVVLDPI